MNEKFYGLVKNVAAQVVAQKIADGQVDLSASPFEDLAREVERQILIMAEKFGTPEDAEPAKPTRPSGKRNEAKPTRTRNPPAVSEEDKEIVRKQVQLLPGKALGEIVTLTGLGEATVRNALKALEASGVVQSAKGINPPGKRGAPPTVYSVA